VASPLLDSLYAYYPLNEASGDAQDTVGSNDLTAVGTLVYGVAGIEKSCITFGSGDNLETSATVFEFTTNFSIAWWAKTGAVTESYEALVNNYGAGGTWGYGYDLIMANTGTVYCNFRWSSSRVLLSKSGLTLEDDSWHHYVITCAQADDDSVKLYIDNVLESKGKLSSDVAYAASCEFGVGAEPATNSKYWKGEIDAVMIWRGREVTPDDVTALWAAGSGIFYDFSE